MLVTAPRWTRGACRAVGRGGAGRSCGGGRGGGGCGAAAVGLGLERGVGGAGWGWEVERACAAGARLGCCNATPGRMICFAWVGWGRGGEGRGRAHTILLCYAQTRQALQATAWLLQPMQPYGNGCCCPMSPRDLPAPPPPPMASQQHLQHVRRFGRVQRHKPQLALHVGKGQEVVAQRAKGHAGHRHLAVVKHVRDACEPRVQPRAVVQVLADPYAWPWQRACICAALRGARTVCHACYLQSGRQLQSMCS